MNGRRLADMPGFAEWMLQRHREKETKRSTSSAHTSSEKGGPDRFFSLNTTALKAMNPEMQICGTDRIAPCRSLKRSPSDRWTTKHPSSTVEAECTVSASMMDSKDMSRGTSFWTHPRTMNDPTLHPCLTSGSRRRLPHRLSPPCRVRLARQRACEMSQHICVHRSIQALHAMPNEAPPRASSAR